MKKFLGILLVLINVVIFYFCINYIVNNFNEEDARLILDYIKAIIWPTIIIIFIIILKPNIQRFIDESDYFKSNLFEIKRKTDIQKQEDSISKGNEKEFQNNIQKFDEIIKIQKQEITKLSLNNQQLLDILTRKEVELEFERIFNVIFSGQISLLQKIKYSYGKKFHDWEAIKHFLIQRQIFSVLNKWNYDQYLNFLFYKKLIEKTPNELILTIKGEAFLNYLAIMGYKKDGL